jgi:hypothetical protein
LNIDAEKKQVTAMVAPPKSDNKDKKLALNRTQKRGLTGTLVITLLHGSKVEKNNVKFDIDELEKLHTDHKGNAISDSLRDTPDQDMVDMPSTPQNPKGCTPIKDCVKDWLENTSGVERKVQPEEKSLDDFLSDPDIDVEIENPKKALPRFKLQHNDLVEKNQLHIHTLNVIERWTDPTIKEKLLADFYGRGHQLNGVDAQNIVDAESSVNSESDQEDFDYDPKQCTGILVVEFEDLKHEIACTLLMNEKHKSFVILTNAADVVKKRLDANNKLGFIFPKKITLVVIDNYNYEQYEIPMKGFKIHPEYTKDIKFVPSF